MLSPRPAGDKSIDREFTVKPRWLTLSSRPGPSVLYLANGMGVEGSGAPVSEAQSGEWKALIERVVASSAFRKSNRLRELFLFLCERTMAGSGVVHEQEIGVRIFGRLPDYDPAQDALARVQVSQLRKRLEQYFSEEGRDEPVIVDIPKGTYTPVFRRRSAPQPDVGSAPSPERRRDPKRRILTLLPVALVVGIAGIAAFWAVASASRPSSGKQSGGAVNALWRQMFDNGRPICVVVSDANLGLFEDEIQGQLSLEDYRNKAFIPMVDQRIPNPERARWKALLRQYSTHISDAELASTFAVLNATHHFPTQIVFAQDFGAAYVQSHNLILLGSRRTNPWVDLFAEQLNFRSGFQEVPPLAYFENRSPRPGESPAYPVTWQKRGYCLVAFLPNPTGKGNALIISGTDMASTEAGGPFISTERWVSALGAALGLTANSPFPYFEVLLKVDYAAWNTSKFDIVAHRVVAASPAAR